MCDETPYTIRRQYDERARGLPSRAIATQPWQALEDVASQSRRPSVERGNALRNLSTVLMSIGVVSALVLTGCLSTDSEAGEHSGGEGSESGERGDGEESATQYGLGDTFDQVRAGARLILSYDSDANAFIGTVENTTDAALNRVRVEVHLSNGTELGPTTPVSLAPGQVVAITLPATGQAFTSWSAHPEVG